MQHELINQMEEAAEPFVKDDSPLRGYERGETVRPKVVRFPQSSRVLRSTCRSPHLCVS